MVASNETKPKAGALKSAAPPAATGAAAPIKPDPPVAKVGTAEQVAQGATDAVVIGAAETAIEPGGPGVGAARVATEAQGFASRPLTEGAIAELGLRPLTEAERTELERLRERPDERTELEMLRRLRAPGVTISAADVEGKRLARAATSIKRGGVIYAPGTEREWVPLDFEGYTELVSIGAITDTRWEHLDRDAG